MRPSQDVHKSRSIWRMISVFVGASTASILLTLNLSPLMIVALAGGALIVAVQRIEVDGISPPPFQPF